MTDIQLNANNFGMLRRLDEDHDGRITSAEANHAIDHAGLPSEVAQQFTRLTPKDQAAIQQVLDSPDAVVQIRFNAHPITGPDGWSSAEGTLQLQTAGNPVVPVLQGQGRLGNLEVDGDNNDCGQTTAQYLHARRLQASGQSIPHQSYAEADLAIASVSFGSEGSGASDIQKIMQDHHAQAGKTHYTFQRELFTNADQMEAAVRRGLASDPGGVIVPITYQRVDDRPGFGHAIAVTGIDPEGTVHYFDPGGVDGSDHTFTMPLAELRRIACYDQPQMAVVYGVPDHASQTPHLATGHQLAELDHSVRNRPITVTDFLGAYTSRDTADHQARLAAARQGSDAVVVQEGSRFAVYGVTEVRTQFGGWGSANTLTNVDPSVRAVYMTDPQTKRVRTAHLPGQ